ncbi:carotenoid oxygenase [Caulobacter sp. SLTY]|uniref:carotenoid oxygenase family protein n=1 Tax=Caulobacter sp. SLTY TaxID=2683262 RepID=UPI001412FA84|nr:carotenoid oxygenase family protein [Caulobacter sp. SLTY]NBB14718.1 carotenoid oxygenase [Caulobacter sp. SLTY]
MDGEIDIRAQNPFLRGNFAPLRSEDDFELEAKGAWPEELSGTLYRIGPNPQFDPTDKRYHWFGGDGMVHAFDIAKGAVRYRNRYVRTPRWQTEHAAGRVLYGVMGNPMTTDPSVMGTDSGVANTNIMLHAGRLLALEEAHAPFEVAIDDLSPVGYRDFGGKVTAHPKVDPRTGEMVFFAYADDQTPLSNKVSWGVADADGVLKKRETFEAPYCSMIHDFALTDRFVVLPVLPLTGDLSRAMGGKPPFAWEPEKGAMLTIIDRERGVESLRWAKVSAGYAFHVTNAWDQGDTVIVDVMRYPQAPFFPLADGSPGKETGAVSLRWTIDLSGDEPVATETVLDDLAGEFPRIDERRAQVPHGHAWFSGQARRPGDIRGDCLAHLDLQTGVRAVWTREGLGGVGEPVFTPKSADAAEGEGWILTILYWPREDYSELAVFDALDVAAGPVATAPVPRRIPFGFHANFVAA